MPLCTHCRLIYTCSEIDHQATCTANTKYDLKGLVEQLGMNIPPDQQDYWRKRYGLLTPLLPIEFETLPPDPNAELFTTLSNAPKLGGIVSNWDNKSVDELLADMNELANEITGEGGHEVPDTIVLSPQAYEAIERARQARLYATGSRGDLWEALTEALCDHRSTWSVAHKTFAIYEPVPLVVVVCVKRGAYQRSVDENVAIAEVVLAKHLVTGVVGIVTQGPSWGYWLGKPVPLRLMTHDMLCNALEDCERRLMTATSPNQEADWGMWAKRINDELERRRTAGEPAWTYPDPRVAKAA